MVEKKKWHIRALLHPKLQELEIEAVSFIGTIYATVINLKRGESHNQEQKVSNPSPAPERQTDSGLATPTAGHVTCHSEQRWEEAKEGETLSATFFGVPWLVYRTIENDALHSKRSV